MSKQQITGPCCEREDKEGKQIEEITKTLNQAIIIKTMMMIITVMGEITKKEMMTEITNKEMIDKDQTDSSQIDQADKEDHTTKETDDQISKTIRNGID